MYSILIVEDEEFVRNGIKYAVEGLELGFDSIMTAKNGIEAVGIIDNAAPDIILSDVKMPKMNGLELARYVRENHPEIQFVLLSAYDDFGYAQEAIKWGVRAYLLKPLKEKLLKQTLRSIINDKKADDLAEDVSPHTQKELFLKNMIRGIDLHEEYIRENTEKYKLPGRDEYFRAAVCISDDIKNVNAGFNDFICKLLWDTFEINSVVYHDNIVLFINSETAISKGETQKSVERYTEYYCKCLSERYGIQCKITAGVGNVYKGIENFHNSYNEAVYSCSCRYFYRGLSFIFYQDLQKKDYADLDDKETNELVTQIINSVFSQDLLGIKKHTHDFFSMVLFKGTFLIEHIHTKCLDIIFEISYRLKSSGRDIEFKKNEYVKGIKSIENIEELKNWLEKCLVSISSQMDTDSDSKDFIGKAKKYVSGNYTEKITLSSIAEYLHINPAYLSHSFKRITGESLVDYINDVRIQEAKKMLKNPEVRVKDVYFRVGFSDYSYFCKVFKRVTGTSPLNYKYQKLL